MTLPFLTPLYGEDLRDAGVPAPFALGHADRVRFHELDVFNHVNNARYLSWFETFRITYLRSGSLAKYAKTNARPVLVLKSVTLDFKAPLHLEDTYVVAGRTRAFRRTSFTMEYGVWSGGRHCASSQAVICLMQDDFVTPRPLPEAYVTHFQTQDGGAFEG